MKLRILCIVVTLLLLVPLSACNFIAPETDRPFAVNLPESWVGRATVDYLDDGADIVIDGKPMLSLRVVENIPGAREKAEALLADGYWWIHQIEFITSEYYYFLKRDEACPEDLRAFEYPLEHDLLEIECVEGKTDLGKTYLKSFGVLKTNTYTNHILGISFTVPESIREKCWFTITAHGWIHLYLRTGTSSEMYALCEIFALEPGNDYQEMYLIQPEYYPEVVYHEDGYIYGAINEWQPDIFRGYYGHPVWDYIPLNYRNMITTEEVQQIVDSFTILSDAPDSGN